MNVNIRNIANLQPALDLAAVGFAVFPVDSFKRPKIKGWQTKATTDPRQIRQWFTRWPDAMPAIPTGQRNGVAVLDLDCKDGKNGIAELHKLGLDPDSLSPIIVASPSGGRHVFFRWPDGMGNSAAGLPPGIDVRGEGGLVVAPGAVNGKGTYALLSGDVRLLADLRDVGVLPDWPAALMPRRRAPEAGQGDPTSLPLAVIESALMACPNGPDVGRDDWTRMGFALHCETGGSAEGLALFHGWSALHDSYDVAKTDAFWTSAKPDGGVTGWHIIHEARRHGWRDATVEELLAQDDLADLSDLPTAEEEAAIEALVWGPPEDALTVADDDFGSPMMQGDKPINNQHNAILYLGRNLDSILPDLSHNEMTHRDEWRGGEVTDATIVLTRTALERRGLKTIGKELVSDAVLTVARRRRFHPVRGYLNGLVPDGGQRLDSWLVRHAGAEDTPYVRAVSRKFLVQMVARVMQPGCKADHTLVLIGPQGAGKSALCRLLAGDSYFTDTLPAIAGGKDVMEHLQGIWLAELAELAPSRKSEAEDLKAFLTGMVDRFRVAYGKRTEAFQRQCVFVGTTNDDQFLRDVTGRRRFWPVHVGKIDLEGLAAERDQLFAEAVAAYRAGEPWWLDRDFEAEHARPMQDAARVVDSWEDDIAAWLAKSEADIDGSVSVKDKVTLSEVMTDALSIPPAQQTMAIQNRVAAVLKTIGWTKKHTMKGKVWKGPEA